MKFIKFTFFIILIFLPIANWAMDIQEFKTKNGLKFWFVEDKSIPIIRHFIKENSDGKTKMG